MVFRLLLRFAAQGAFASLGPVVLLERGSLNPYAGLTLTYAVVRSSGLLTLSYAVALSRGFRV